MDAFLLPDTHDRIRCFREALRSGPGLMVKRERAKEPDFWDWNLSRVKDLTLHIAYRQNTGIEERNRWLTGWNTRGRKQLAPGLWPELFDCWNYRRLDMVDCFGISASKYTTSVHHRFSCPLHITQILGSRVFSFLIYFQSMTESPATHCTTPSRGTFRRM
jgi:hypothetical protein